MKRGATKQPGNKSEEYKKHPGHRMGDRSSATQPLKLKQRPTSEAALGGLERPSEVQQTLSTPTKGDTMSEIVQEAPKALKELSELDPSELLDLIRFEMGWSVSDLKPATVDLRHSVYTTHPEVTHNWTLTLDFFITWDDQAYNDYNVDVYTRPNSDKLWHNQEEIAPIDCDLATLQDALRDAWWCEG